MIQSKLMA